MCHVCVSGLILFRTLSDSWTWMSVSFSRLEKISAIISSSKFSSPFLLSSSGISLMWILFYWFCPKGPLRYLHLKNFFFISLLVWVSSIVLSSSLLIYFSASSNLLLNSFRVFFSSAITYIWSFLEFSISLLKFSLCLSILLLSSVSIFITITLNSLSRRLFIFILFSSFSGVLFCSWIETYSSSSSFCLQLCACFGVLGKSAMWFVLKEWPYLGVVLWGSAVQCHWSTRARSSRDAPYEVYVPLPDVVGPQWAGLLPTFPQLWGPAEL